MKEKDITIEYLQFGSDANIAIAVEKERSNANAHHHYAIVTQDGELELAHLDFQEGPIQEKGINGIQNEQLLGIVIDRLIGFQSGDFACSENQVALESVLSALSTLQMRTAIRQARGVEGKSIK